MSTGNNHIKAKLLQAVLVFVLITFLCSFMQTKWEEVEVGKRGGDQRKLLRWF